MEIKDRGLNEKINQLKKGLEIVGGKSDLFKSLEPIQKSLYLILIMKVYKKDSLILNYPHFTNNTINYLLSFLT